MCPKWFYTISVLLITSFASSASLAQSLPAEKTKLADFEQQLSQLQIQQQQLQTQLSQSEAELAPLLNQKTPEQTKLDQAQTDLTAAEAAFEADPTDANKAKQKNVEFKYALAERKFKKANSKQFELKEQVSSLNQQLTATTNEITALNSSIIDQRTKVEQLQTKDTAARQARLAEEERLKAAAAEAEIARLTAQLEQQNRDELARKQLEAEAAEAAKSQSAAAAAVTAAAVTSQATSAATNTAAAPTASTAVAKPASTTPAKPAAAATNGSSGIYFLSRVEQVTAEEQLIAEIIASPEEKKSSRYNKILNVKTVDSNGVTGKADANTLRPKGHSIYRGTATLKGGDTLFIVGFNRWRYKVPVTANDTEYVIIYDGSDSKNPRLICFQKSLRK